MRYLSLDFYRGLTIALMIVVNNPGTWAYVYPPLEHAAWNGCTPTDLVFPFFLFIVGVSLWFSLSKFHQQPGPEVTRKLLRRVALIFLVGLALNAYPFFGKDWSSLRIMGVLQRIALAYGLAAFLCVWLSRQTLLLTGGLMLAVYWTLLHLGGSGSDPYALATNLPRMVDLQVLTARHMYGGFGIAFDPEGLLPTIPAAVTVMLGYLTGSLIGQYAPPKFEAENPEATAARPYELLYDLMWYGTTIGAAGLLWGLMFPINKPLWTSSYVLYAGGLSMIALAVCIWALDFKGWTRLAKPFLVFGANPLFAFVLSGVLLKTINLIKYTDETGMTRNGQYWLYQHVFYPINQQELGSLLYALAYTALIWLICLGLYRRKIFIKI